MDLRAKAIDIRKDIVNLIYHAGTGTSAATSALPTFWSTYIINR